LPRLQALQDEFGSLGYVSIAVNLWQDMEGIVKPYARQYSYAHYRDGGSLWNLYKMNNYIPLNYVIDYQGNVVGSMEGFNEATIRSWIQQGLPPSGVAEKPVAPVRGLAAACGPNPVRDRAQFRFSAPAAAQYRIGVYALDGTLVRELAGAARAGENSVTWLRDGSVARGVYAWRLACGSETVSGKLVVTD
jgi:hypothetical protein